ncbi:MAG TPA: response regulator [Polyangia bacterium]|nr:response regulator [Polyangia bacterium]
MRKVLVVEDDEELQRALRSTLEDEGYLVECATDGAQALELLRASPDAYLILLDLILPRVNGWEFRARQAEDARLAQYPVVVMTATSNLEDAAIDAADVLQKPIVIPQLLETVARHFPVDEFDDAPKTEPRAAAADDGEAVPLEIPTDDTLRN